MPSAFGLVEAEQAAGDHQLDRGRLADDAHQALGAAGAGQHAERDLGQAELGRAAAGDPQVGRHRDLEAAADGVAVERRDHQLRRLLEPRQRLVGVQAEVVLEVRVRRLEHVDVGAGAEDLLAGAGEHDDVDRRVEAGLEDAVVELAHHLVGVGVGRRVVEGEVGDPLPDLVVHQRARSGLDGVLRHPRPPVAWGGRRADPARPNRRSGGFSHGPGGPVQPRLDPLAIAAPTMARSRPRT